MEKRYSSIYSGIEKDDDEPLLALTNDSDRYQTSIPLRTINDPMAANSTTLEHEVNADDVLSSIPPGLSPSNKCTRIPARYITAIWAFFGFFCLYAVRVNLSLAIVAMVRVRASRRGMHELLLAGTVAEGIKPNDHIMSGARRKFHHTAIRIASCLIDR
jgi:hypothetical protein